MNSRVLVKTTKELITKLKAIMNNIEYSRKYVERYGISNNEGNHHNNVVLQGVRDIERLMLESVQ